MIQRNIRIRRGHSNRISNNRNYNTQYNVNNNTYRRGMSNQMNITPQQGNTSVDAGHNHQYKILSDGSVIIYEAVHPTKPHIRHRHEYQGKWPHGRITNASSNCWPNCSDGAPPHEHRIIANDNMGSGATRTITNSMRR